MKAGGITDVLVAGRRQTRLYHLTLFALAAAAIAAIWSVQYLALPDMPNHLARLFILHEQGNVAAFQRDYRLDVFPVPNLGVEMIGLPLMRFFDVYTVGKIVASVYVVLFVWGCDRLGRALHGAPTWMTIPVLFLCFNFNFLYGFLAYSLGVALFLLTFAYWLGHRDRPTPQSVLVSSGLATLCYLTHLSAAVFLIAAIGVYTAADGWRKRRLARPHWVALVPIAPMAALYIGLSAHVRITQTPVWPHPADKLHGLGWVYGGTDLLVGRTLIGLLAAAGLVLLVGRPRRQGSRLPFVLAGLFGLGYLVSPISAANSHFVDVRFILPMLVFATVGWRLQVTKRAAQVALLLAVVAGLGRMASVAAEWRQREPEIAAQVDLLRRLPEQIDLHPLLMESPHGSLPFRVAVGYRHLSLYAVIERRVNHGTLFAKAGAQPLLLDNPAPKWLLSPPHIPPDDGRWGEVFARYRYLWGFQVQPAYRARLAASCAIVGEAGPVTIFGPCRTRP